MDVLIPMLAALVAVTLFNRYDQQKRIAQLAQHLHHYQIEALMEKLAQGYMRALDEQDPARQSQIWSLLEPSERSLMAQFTRFANAFAKENEAHTRVNKLAIGLPWLNRVWPAASFDLRQAFLIHAQGIVDAATNTAQRSPRDKAFMLSAELFLMQHTCHWFCRSRATASARLLRRHQTRHDQVVAAVSPATRQAYQALTGV